MRTQFVLDMAEQLHESEFTILECEESLGMTLTPEELDELDNHVVQCSCKMWFTPDQLSEFDGNTCQWCEDDK